MRLLVIEDEDQLREDLGQRLQKEGFAVDTAADGIDGLHAAREYPIDLAIVDIGLPGKDGVEIIRTIRAEGLTYPVLILTARDRWQDKVVGLEAGADDYLAKPFAVEELLARVNALLRRSRGLASAVSRFGDYTLDTKAQDIQVAGESLKLTTYEYRLAEYLMLHAGEVVSKMDLFEHLYAEEDDRDSNVLEVFVGRVRRKLDPDNQRQPIETLRGRGYRFAYARSD